MYYVKNVDIKYHNVLTIDMLTSDKIFVLHKVNIPNIRLKY